MYSISSLCHAATVSCSLNIFDVALMKARIARSFAFKNFPMERRVNVLVSLKTPSKLGYLHMVVIKQIIKFHYNLVLTMSYVQLKCYHRHSCTGHIHNSRESMSKSQKSTWTFQKVRAEHLVDRPKKRCARSRPSHKLNETKNKFIISANWFLASWSLVTIMWQITNTILRPDRLQRLWLNWIEFRKKYVSTWN